MLGLRESPTRSDGARLSGGLVDASVGLLTNVGMFVAAEPDTREEAHEDVLMAQNLAERDRDVVVLSNCSVDAGHAASRQ
jgi:hypothetical protein